MGVRKHPDKSKSNACPDAAVTPFRELQVPSFGLKRELQSPSVVKRALCKKECVYNKALYLWANHNDDKWKLPLVKALLLSESLIKWVSLYFPLNPGRQTLLILNPQSNTGF